MKTFSNAIFSAILGLAALLAPLSARPQANWPSKPLVVISPAPGSSADFLPRIVYEQVAKELGTVLVMDFKQGLGGTIALEAVARSAPDGSLGIASTIQGKTLRYDPMKDFAAVARLVTTGNVIAVNKDVPINTIPELIAYAKEHPGKLNFAAIAGFGTSYHLAWVLFAKRVGIDVVQIPFKGVADATQATMAGDVQLIMSNTNTLLSAIQSGRLRALAVTTAAREPSLPNVPTMSESGLPGYEATSWFGTIVRAGTPPAIVERLSAVTLKVMQDPKVIAQLQKIGLDPYPQNNKDFDAFYLSEITRWSQVVKDSGFKVEEGK